MDRHVENTFVTSTHLESVLQKALDTKCTVASWTSKILSAERGFLSTVIRIALEWNGTNNDSLPASVILKIPTTQKLVDIISVGELHPEQQIETGNSEFFARLLIAMHNAECSFYQLQPPPDKVLKVPKVIVAKKITAEDGEGYLIMEDLSEVVADRYISEDLPLEAIFELLDFLAELHAYSLTSSDWHLNADLASNGRRLSDRVRANQNGVRNSIKLLAEYMPALKQYTERSHELYQCLETDGDIWLPCQEELGSAVICSGDLWTNNILWKKNNDGKPSDKLAAVVDWQCSHPGEMTEDLAILLISSTSTEIRRTHLHEMLDHYYVKLQENLGMPPPFELSQVHLAFRRSYQRCFFRLVVDFPIFIKMCDGNDEDVKVVFRRCQAVVEDAFAVLDGKEFGSYSQL